MCEYVCTPYGLTIDGRNEGEYDRRERVVRCRDCKHAYERGGELDCTHFSQWDYYNDCPGEWIVEPDGFCAWGKPREEG